MGGPNGSGKSTFADAFLGKNGRRQPYLNPDVVAAGLGPQNFERTTFQAGRILLREVRERISSKESFGFESTLSGRTWIPILQGALDDGYKIVIYFLCLKNVRKNLERIKKRVLLGGHNIPTATVRRRHSRCFENFWLSYRPLCQDWYVFENSSLRPRLVLSSASFLGMAARDQEEFESQFLKGDLTP